jgi:arylsulfatase A-like enzyme
LHENYLTLAEILRYTGFQTAAFIQNPNAGPFSGLHQGFSYLFDMFDKANGTPDMYGKKVIEWIKNHNESNYFLYLHVTDPHGPYDPPENLRHWYNHSSSGKDEVSRIWGVDPRWVTTPTLKGRRALYDGEIKNNDYYFESFLTGLEKLNSLDHTLIIFMADHGEHLGEHDLWTHKPPGFIQVIKTPLIMVYPKKLPRNRIITQPVQNLDIVPTILDLIKINKANLLLAGDSLLSLIYQKEPGYWNNRIIISDEGVNRGEVNKMREFASIIYKDTHILNSNQYSPMQQFNYWNDREEIKGITVPGNSKKFYKRFLRDLHKNNGAIWEAITKGIAARTKYDPETIKKLKSLGYIK